MKKYFAFALVLLLTLGVVPAMGEAAAVRCEVVEIDIYGRAFLDITGTQFEKAGFDLGDIVTVTCGGYTGDMPCFNGYYLERGSCMLYVNPYLDTVSLCVNYGSFAELASIGVGDAATIALKEKGGALRIQEIHNLVYDNDRAHSPSDEAFANFRPVVAGKLYRCASPVDNLLKRAACADRLIRQAGVQTVMNMADTPETIKAHIAAEDFDSPYYRELFEAGKVFAKELLVDFEHDDFAKGIAEGFTFLADGETPYLVHCLEGKDRTGFAVMLLESLMGWDVERIVDDYMQTYANYFGIEPGSEAYTMILEMNLEDMMRTEADVADDVPMEAIDLKAAAEAFLIDSGMAAEKLKLLEAKLTSD